MPTNFKHKIRSVTLHIIYELYHAEIMDRKLNRVIKYFAVNVYCHLQFNNTVTVLSRCQTQQLCLNNGDLYFSV